MIRRDFLKFTATGAIGAYFQPSWLLDNMPKIDLAYAGLQLYTVHREMEDNPLHTLRTIKSIGYSHVEGASYDKGRFYGQTKENFVRILQDTGLKMYSNHIEYGKPEDKVSFDMHNNWEKVCEDAAFMGQKYLVCPSLPSEVRKSVDNYKRTAQFLNKCGEKAKNYGLQLCYHNHAFEFSPLGKILPYDILLSETDPNSVKFELDIYWATRSGMNIRKLINKNPGRFSLFHIKDMNTSPEKGFTEVGTGVINWKNIFTLSEKAGLKYFYIEQDEMTKYTPLESIRVSFNNLVKIQN